MKLSTRRSRRALAAALLATALPLVAVGPAHASTTESGCTVSPLTPVYTYINPAGDKVIRYNMTVTCDANRTVEIEQHVHEADTINADDHITTSNRLRFFGSTDTVTMWLENSLPDTEIGDEEMYQHVSFRVTSNGVTSPWTDWEDSPEQQFSK
jgi:hypothetical protein